MQEEEVDVAARGQRAQHGEVTGGGPGEAEERDARRPGGEGRRPPRAVARRAGALRGVRAADAPAQAPPQLRLLVPGVLPGGPAADELRTLERVAVEEVGEMADDGEAAGAPLALDVGGQGREPRLPGRPVADRPWRPDP